MGGAVSTQVWDDYINEDFERQLATDRGENVSPSEKQAKVSPPVKFSTGDLSSESGGKNKKTSPAIGGAESKEAAKTNPPEKKSGKIESPSEKQAKVPPAVSPAAKISTLDLSSVSGEKNKKTSPTENSETSEQTTPRAFTLDSKTDMRCQFAEYKLTQKLSIREIYELFQSAHNKNTGTNWAAKPSLYETCANLLHKRGEPVMADLVFHEGLKVVKEPAWLAKLKLGKARALAQTRSTAEAIKLLQSLPQEIQENEQDALNLFGRCYKDMAGKFGQDAQTRTAYLRKSFRYYNECFEQSRDTYPGINAATVAFLLRETGTAHALANNVADMSAKQLEKIEGGNDYWVQATLGECNVILGAWPKARYHYGMAMKADGVTDRMRRSTRTQFRKLIAHVTSKSGNNFPIAADKLKEFQECSEEIEAGFHIPNVVLFISNKQITGPQQYTEPSEAMERSLDELLDENNAGYCFSTCYPGPDMAFCEAALRRGVELYVVLPSPVEYYREHTGFNPKQAARFDFIVQRASAVEVSNDMTKDATPINYQYTCYWASGKASMKSEQVDTSLIRIHTPAPAQGSASGYKWSCDPWVIKLWRKKREKFITWRPEIFKAKDHGKNAPLELSVNRKRSMLLTSRSGPPQIIKAILFADVVGYSKLKEHEVFFFVKNFLGKAANLIHSTRADVRPAVRNTWGDAFYFVFHSVRAGGVFSLLLRDMVKNTDWQKEGLPSTLSIRISMHAGPVFPVMDRVLNEQNFTGVHTSRAARIEPITRPGSVYCSRAFAALTSALGEKEFSCEFIGNVPLAKKYGMLPVHVVEWRSKRKDGYHSHTSSDPRVVPLRLRRSNSDSTLITMAHQNGLKNP